MRKELALLSLLLVFSLVYSCTPGKKSVYKKSKVLMDTFVTITVVSATEEEADKAIEAAFSVIDRFGSLINFFSDKSELAAVNRNAGIGEVRVSPETLDLIETAVSISEKSGGAFDATIGPVMKLWDFHEKIRPPDNEIRKNLNLVNYKYIVVNRKKATVFMKRKGMVMDLGGIAKGYAADLAVAALRQQGVQSGIVAAAGDIRTFGSKPDGKPWTVGIRNPRQTGEADEIMARIDLSDRAISTSGDYERFFEEDGRRYHHILDPKTGYPGGLCRSVTVIADRGVLTDAFSTAVFILGPERGMKLMQDAGLEGVIIDTGGIMYTTPGLKGKLTVETGN